MHKVLGSILSTIKEKKKEEGSFLIKVPGKIHQQILGSEENFDENEDV